VSSLQDIRRGNRLDGTEILHVADETNCTQWIHVLDIGDDEPFQRRCEECSVRHVWRRVLVKA